jgi:hypothetical protein
MPHRVSPVGRKACRRRSPESGKTFSPNDIVILHRKMGFATASRRCIVWYTSFEDLRQAGL